MVIFFFFFLLSFFFGGLGGGGGGGGERCIIFPVKITNNKFLYSYCNKKVALPIGHWVFGLIYGTY